MEKKIFKLDFYGREITIENGELAKQATGSVLVRYGDTVVLSVCVMSKNTITADFFPLTVMYNEKLYSVGKIPGGFIKREGRPTSNATLSARLIDRPLRPLFDENFRNEVQVINTILSVDQDNSPEMTAMLGSSLSLCISPIPFDGPIAGVIVGRVNGEFVINPTVEQDEISDLHLTVAGTKTAINMVEAGAKQLSEDIMLDAIMFGHEAIKKLIAFEEEVASSIGLEKVEVELASVSEELSKEVHDYLNPKMLEAIQIKDKLAKYAKIDEVKEEALKFFEEKYQENENVGDILKDVKKLADEIEGETVRTLIIDTHVRTDGRKWDEIKPL